jgi:hypothetical protein
MKRWNKKSRIAVQLRLDELVDNLSELSPPPRDAFVLSDDPMMETLFQQNKSKSEDVVNDSSRKR